LIVIIIVTNNSFVQESMAYMVTLILNYLSNQHAITLFHTFQPISVLLQFLIVYGYK